MHAAPLGILIWLNDKPPDTALFGNISGDFSMVEITERLDWAAAQPAANENNPLPLVCQATPADVRRLFGRLEDRYVAEILRTDPSLEELQEAYSWLDVQGTVLARRYAAKAYGIAAILSFVTYGTGAFSDDQIAWGNFK